MCPPGYKQYGDRCLDIDECLEQQGLCPSPGTCKNTDGSFRCVCPRGFKLDETGTFCVDSNECDDDSRCEDGCKNNVGSYQCGCPDGFQLHLYFNQCVDKDECADPVNPCGNNKCTNTIGSYNCGCPNGYQFDRRMSICIQSAGGCNNSPCAFGCNPVGPKGFSCECPRGYQTIGDGHCVATVNPSSFNRLGNSWDYDDQYEEGKDDFISTEGCFACQMNGGKRSSSGRRSRNQGRRRRRSRNRRSSEMQSSKEHFLETIGILDSSKKIALLGNNITVQLMLTIEQTKNRRRVVKLQPARNDLMHSIVYDISKDPSKSLEIKRKAGVWGLYFKKRVTEPTSFTVWVRGQLKKGPTANHDIDLHAVLRIQIVRRRRGSRKKDLVN